MTLVITDGEFWWSWRELNPRLRIDNSMIIKDFYHIFCDAYPIRTHRLDMCIFCTVRNYDFIEGIIYFFQSHLEPSLAP